MIMTAFECLNLVSHLKYWLVVEMPRIELILHKFTYFCFFMSSLMFIFL